MRTYETTHPWLTFSVDMHKARPRLWMLLGEAQSKCDHIAGVPLRTVTAEKLHLTYFSKGVQATAAIEGNTLTEEEVAKRIKGTLDLPPSKEYLGLEIDNLISAFKRIFELQANSKSDQVSTQAVKAYNRQVLEGLKQRPDVVPGEITRVQVGVPAYRGAPPEDCEYLLDRLCEWLNSDVFHPPDAPPVAAGIIRAVIAHLYLVWIHPFGDGNGRTARLVEFQILVAAGAPTPAAHLLSNHYNQTRDEYYRQLQYASASKGDVLPFIEYAVQGFVDGLQHQVDLIREQQWSVTWEDYVHDRFRNKTKPPDTRRRHLLLDLSGKPEVVPLQDVRHISPRIAEAYAGKTKITITRDVRTLESMDLVEITDAGVRAKKETILAFLPARRQSDQPGGA